MHTTLDPKHANNEWYEQLCALAAIGELSSSEFNELQQHLAECSECRELYADFRRISSDDLGLVAVLKRADAADELAELPDEQGLFRRLFDLARRERAVAGNAIACESREAKQPPYRVGLMRIAEWLRRPALSYGAVAVLLCSLVAIGAYRLRDAELAPTLRELSFQLRDWKSRANAHEAQARSTSESLQQSQSEREALQKFLVEAQLKLEELQAEQKNLESQLAAARAALDQKGQELDSAKTREADKDARVVQLETRLQNANQRAAEQERIADSLRSRLLLAEQAAEQAALNAPESQGFSDPEAKELFGARDLHIVDVYDVGSNGKTRRTYGRVFYVEKRLLVFYAFDLEDKKRNRAAAGFQAWGYRQPNSQTPENLGLFQVDDASANRWVLKVNDPRVLERIDAVFVTLESPNGSRSPRGRKLLYANLAGPPNHPF